MVPKPFRIRFDKTDGFIMVLDGKIKQLVLFDYGLFDKICNKIKYLVSKKVVLQVDCIVVTNDLCSDKEPKDIPNDVMQLAQSVKADANKVALSHILPSKDKFNSQAKEVNTHLQDISSSNNLALITLSNTNHTVTYNVKDLHLNNNGDKQLTINSLILMKMVHIILIYL